MSTKVLVTTVVVLFSMFNGSSWAEGSAIQPDRDEVVIEVAADAKSDTNRSAIISAKRVELSNAGEGVDCFYTEENAGRAECSGTNSKSKTR
jgi:hypothetical protein